jgi:hypothetical protein
VIGIDIGKNTFHLVGLGERGAIVLRQKLSRGQVSVRLANVPPCLVGMEACVGAYHLSRQLLALGHDVKLVPGQFVKPFLKGQKNDFRDAEAVAEAVQRPTMRFVPINSVDQLDLQALHRVRSRLVSRPYNGSEADTLSAWAAGRIYMSTRPSRSVPRAHGAFPDTLRKFAVLSRKFPVLLLREFPRNHLIYRAENRACSRSCG